MADFDWKAVVKTVAPGLATAFGGPLAGMAVKVLGDQLLGKPDASEEEVAAAVQGLAPSDYIKLKDSERQFQLELQRLEVDLYKTDSADRIDARAMQASTGGWERAGTFFLAYFVVGIFSYALWWVLSPNTLPADAARLTLIGAVIGYASAKADQVISFFFGSSVGSRRSSERLGNALDNLSKK